MDQIFPALWSMIGYLPSILVYLAGIGIAIYRWRLHPEVSAFAAIGCGLHLVSGLFWAGYTFLRQVDAAAADTMVASLAMYSTISTLLSAVGTALILTAVFGWRYTVTPGR
jgi:hypothetical protein